MAKIKNNIHYIFVGGLVLIGALVAGLTDYITASFDPSVFKSSAFWTNIVTTNLGTLCIILSILLSKVAKFKINDVDYNNTLAKINSFYDKEYQATVFGGFCKWFNKRIKRETYKERIQKKYSKLKPTLKDLNIYNGQDEKAKEKNKYCRKVKYYNMLLEESYIDSVIDKLNIKYDGISDSLVFSGCVSSTPKRNYVTKNRFLKVTRDLLPRYLLSFGITLIVSSILPGAKDDIGIATVFKTCTKIFTMLTQIYFAINYSNDYCQAVILHDLRYRWSVITDYNMWYLNKTQEQSIKEVAQNG